MSDSYCVILTAVASRSAAEELARLLVTRRLAACVQITPVTSYYVWNDQLHDDAEHLLLIKTAASRYAEIEAAILENHSYEVPEIVQLPIEKGLPAYLEWISRNTSSAGASRG